MVFTISVKGSYCRTSSSLACKSEIKAPPQTESSKHEEKEEAPKETRTLSIMERTDQVDSSLVGLRGKREELEVTCKAFSEGLSALLDGHDEQLAQALKRAELAKDASHGYKQQVDGAIRRSTQLEKELHDHELRAANFCKRLNEIQKLLEEKNIQNATLQQNLEELLVENAGLKDTLKSMEQDVQVKDTAIETLKGKINIASEQIAKLANRNHELEAEMLEMRRYSKSMENKLIEAEKVHSHPSSSTTASQPHLVVPAFPIPQDSDLDDEEVFYFD